MSPTNMTDHSSPIPAPPDFPVTWEHPDDERLFWTHERMGAPDPITPMTFRFVGEEGMNQATEAYEMPIRFHFRRINTYLYIAVAPVPGSPEDLEALGRRSEEKLGTVVERLGEYWSVELLPEVKRHLEYCESFDLLGATRPELLGHLDETVARMDRVWEIHYLIGLPFVLASSMFDELYRELFGDEDAFGAYKLLQGFDNKTLETDRALWQLGRRARSMPEVRKALDEQTDVILALEGSPGGRAFLAELRGYLDEYGRRGSKFYELGEPSWIEDPAPAIENLKSYVNRSDRDPASELAALAAEREWLVAGAREKLKGYPRPIVSQFEALLKAAQEATVLQEDHAFWTDFGSYYQVRRVLLEFGRRLARDGVIEKPDDVFYLTIDELRETARTLPAGDRRQPVAARKAEMEHFRAISPPPALGTELEGPPPDDPMSRAMEKFFGGPPRPSTEPNELRGNAGSPGKVRGPAKVVRSLEEAGKLQPGDILVTEMTAPPWTPLFATAAAIVTDTGGILSHCAVVAREYQIPAVVGAGTATATIRDGQLLEVDGDEGVIRVMEPGM